MAIYEVDDLDDRLRRLEESGVRVVWSGDLPTIRGRHLHPRDVGGTLVSIEYQEGRTTRYDVYRPTGGGL